MIAVTAAATARRRKFQCNTLAFSDAGINTGGLSKASNRESIMDAGGVISIPAIFREISESEESNSEVRREAIFSQVSGGG